MKTKIIIIALAAITLLSFTLTSKKSAKATAKQEQKEHSGFAMQDTNQF